MTRRWQPAGEVGDLEPQGGVPRPRERHQRGAAVDARDPRAAGGEVAGEPAAAAPQVQDPRGAPGSMGPSR